MRVQLRAQGSPRPLFICIGLFAGNAQAAQGMRGGAANQPITVMTNAARSLTQGSAAAAHSGAPQGRS